MESQPTIRQRFNSDLQNRLALIAYVPILCLGVLAAGGLIFLQGSTGVRIFGIFALLGVALSIFVAFKTIASILDTIGRVAGSAEVLVDAQHALLDNNSEPIENWQALPTDTDDELGRLAASINSMHTNTVEVDRNQNESIKQGISNIVINLARRSQTLLDRQVEYIDALESSEEDPERLEQMFKVDHLATRMRRNAESLLVLAEADPGRRRGGPVDIADVLRVAMGEIENYQHIELTSVEPGQVTSQAAVDLAHMSAELMENATQFSPPEAPVEVSGRLDGSHYLISIVDHGMGMPVDQVEQANSVLANPPELGLAMGRSLGFVVIGRLAQRLGAKVALSETPGSGTTASITVPTSVFSKVGDNSGVRRSIVAPEAAAPEPDGAGEDSSRSPALTKLLGLDTSTLDGSAEAAESAAAPAVAEEESWTPPPVTPDAPIPASSAAAAAEAQPTWTPPPVTPDAPGADEPSINHAAEAEVETVPHPALATATQDHDISSRDPEVVAEHDVAAVNDGDDEQTWSPPPVTPEAEDSEPTWSPPAVTPEDAPVDTDDEVAPVAEAADTLPVAETLDPEGAAETSPISASLDDEPAWTPPEVTPGAPPLVKPVAETEAPSNLEEAIPTGDAFESGMASLLEDTDIGESPSEISASSGVVSNTPSAAAATEAVEALRPDDSASTSSGLTRRRRGESKVPIGEGRPVAASARKPEEIRSMLSRYRDGIKGNPSSDVDPSEEG